VKRKMKLSKLQQEVIDLMNNGWELGRDVTYNGRCWMQKGGLGCGGNTKKVGHNTVHALYRKGLIEEHYRFPTAKYTLTSKAR